tara:strand:+ start:406 stop:639 length:234 start_codon:yes stop_codon:yes gene_type:complete
MNKYELKFMLEQMVSSVEKLTDTTAKLSLHIENLNTEIETRQTTIEQWRNKMVEKNDEIIRLRKVITERSPCAEEMN